MKSYFSKLLPLLFIAMLSVAPTHAQAAAPGFGPAGPREGMFDCLGTYDWGCRIIGFLFQSTDNDVVYIKDGQPTSPEAQTPAIKALHAMMAFFSNVLLIFASIKLLYELIQMTAESAQTGQVGGKDANKLWAPIRLVIAIGLLVPLDTGLNSGQYIVLQIAKWGSGVASQAWKLYTEKFADNVSSLTLPTPPRIQSIAYTTAKIYACKGFINFYGTGNDIINAERVSDDNSLKYVFKNKTFNDVCGIIRNTVPLSYFDVHSDQDTAAARQYADANWSDFTAAEVQIADEVNGMLRPLLPTGRNYPKPNTKFLDQVIDAFQKKVSDRVNASNATARNAMQQITDQIQTTAGSQGWTSAGSLFLKITRAQGQLINGALNIPEVTGPNLDALQRYPAAYANYQEFVGLLNNGAREPSGAATLSPTARAQIAASSENQSFIKFLWAFASGVVTNNPADTLFKFLDDAAVWVGLWEADPKKAFGDLGGSSNPFGEIAALGHKKIRLAMNYVGYAILASGGGALLSGVGGMAGKIPVVGGVVGGTMKIGGAMIGALAAIFMMIATLFLLAGVLLAYIVPMLPFTRFFFSILTWLGSLIEAMILVPFMALAFLTPKGEGFAGPNTRNAFFLIFQLFLRPVLCIFGLMCSMLLFFVAAKFLNASFYEATSGIYHNEGAAMQFMQKLVYSVMYVGLIYSAANISFKMIEHIPKHALRWMGGSASEESYDDHSNFMGIATAVGGQQLLGQLQSLPQNIMGPVTKGMEASKALGDARDAKAGNNTTRNMQLLGSGGERVPGKSMGETGAVAMPVGSVDERMAAHSDLKEAEGEARQLENSISDDVAEYSMTTDPGRRAALESRIQNNAHRLHALTGRDRTAALAATGMPIVAPPPLPAHPTSGAPVSEIDLLKERKAALNVKKPVTT